MVSDRGGLGGSLGARGGRWGKKFRSGLLVEVKRLGGGRDKTPKAPPFACGPKIILLLGKQGVWAWEGG